MSDENGKSNVAVEVVEPRRFATIVADEIQAIIDEVLANQGTCCVALAGGKTPSSVYRILARPPKLNEIDWGRLKLFWGDERYVGPEDMQSNYRMVKETLLSQLGSNKPAVFPVDTSLKSAKDSAVQYEGVIRQELSSDAPCFDLMLLGMGQDGHIASLFPNSPLLKSANGICCAATDPSGSSERVTLSPNTILSAHRILFIVKGEAKAEMIKRVLEGDESEEVLPARMVFRAKGRVRWFLDSEAGKLLQESS